MTDLLLAAGAGPSVALMYVVCRRPMRRGRGGDVAGEEVARLRREVAELRARRVAAG